MSSSPDERALGHRYDDVSAAELEALAHRLVWLLDEYETAISQGQVPPAFARQLEQLLLTSERLIAS